MLSMKYANVPAPNPEVNNKTLREMVFKKDIISLN